MDADPAGGHMKVQKQLESKTPTYTDCNLVSTHDRDARRLVERLTPPLPPSTLHQCVISKLWSERCGSTISWQVGTMVQATTKIWEVYTVYDGVIVWIA